MTEKWKDEDWAQDFWYSGKVTRRRVVGWGGGAIGATDAGAGAVARGLRRRPSPTRSARDAAAVGRRRAGGKTALVGLQMAVDRINKIGGINGRPVELDRRRRRVQARRRPPQDREAGRSRTRSTSTSAASSPTSASPACRCSRSTRSST